MQIKYIYQKKKEKENNNAKYKPLYGYTLGQIMSYIYIYYNFKILTLKFKFYEDFFIKLWIFLLKYSFNMF